MKVRPIKWKDPDYNKKERYDFVIIGGGKNGINAAIEASKLGKKVAIVEQLYLGGESFVNIIF